MSLGELNTKSVVAADAERVGRSMLDASGKRTFGTMERPADGGGIGGRQSSVCPRANLGQV